MGLIIVTDKMGRLCPALCSSSLNSPSRRKKPASNRQGPWSSKKLAAPASTACPAPHSTYVWEGQAGGKKPKSFLIIKTDKEPSVKGPLVKAVKALHPASVPEVLALRVKEGRKRNYLRWLLDSVAGPRKKGSARPSRAKPGDAWKGAQEGLPA